MGLIQVLFTNIDKNDSEFTAIFFTKKEHTYGRCKQSGWLGFGPTTFSQSKYAHTHFEYK